MKLQVVIGDELPYRIDWGSFKSAGASPSAAMIRMLSIRNYIPKSLRDRKQVARHIFWSYEGCAPWRKIIRILETDSFD